MGFHHDVIPLLPVQRCLHGTADELRAAVVYLIGLQTAFVRHGNKRFRMASLERHRCASRKGNPFGAGLCGELRFDGQVMACVTEMVSGHMPRPEMKVAGQQRGRGIFILVRMLLAFQCDQKRRRHPGPLRFHVLERLALQRDLVARDQKVGGFFSEMRHFLCPGFFHRRGIQEWLP